MPVRPDLFFPLLFSFFPPFSVSNSRTSGRNNAPFPSSPFPKLPCIILRSPQKTIGEREVYEDLSPSFFFPLLSTLACGGDNKNEIALLPPLLFLP